MDQLCISMIRGRFGAQHILEQPRWNDVEDIEWKAVSRWQQRAIFYRIIFLVLLIHLQSAIELATRCIGTRVPCSLSKPRSLPFEADSNWRRIVLS
jgi:hypothetical protein